MGERLAHRGAPVNVWSPAPRVHLGQLGGTLDPERELALDADFPDEEELARALGVGSEPEAPRSGALMGRLMRARGPEAVFARCGPFAIAWWDAKRQELLLLRDGFGARPLYSTRGRGRYLFASEYKALLALADVPAEPDRDAIRHLQCTRYPKPDATFLAGVVPVARGSLTRVARDRLHTKRVEHNEVRLAERSRAGHVAAVRDAFTCALERQIRGEDPVGVQLSGGFDSALVLAGVRALRPDGVIHSFTAGFGEDDPEIRDARALAAQVGAVHHEIVLAPDRLPDLLPRTVWHMEDPYGREDQVYLYMLAREAAKHVRLLLAGYGADMCFAGMPRHRLVDWALRYPIVRAPLAEVYRFTQTGLPPSGWVARLGAQVLTRGRSFPVPRVRGSRYEPSTDPLRPEGPVPLGAFLARGLDDDCGWEALETLHAAFGLRFHAPYMDRELVRVALSLPDELRIRRGVGKWALREAGRALLPARVVRRRKTLQRLRHDARLAEVLDALADRWLAPADIAARGLFEPGDVERLRRRRPGAAYPEAQAHRLWTLLVTELWCRLFLDQRGKRPV
jgi:asparagine synthase (glutamine-hydrolysing)